MDDGCPVPRTGQPLQPLLLVHILNLQPNPPQLVLKDRLVEVWLLLAGKVLLRKRILIIVILPFNTQAIVSMVALALSLFSSFAKYM